MGTHYLEHFFRPESIAVVGASETPGSVGEQVMRNLLDAGFRGAISPVNPRHGEVHGLACAPRVRALEHAPDLAVICVPPRAIHQVVEECGRHGIRAVVILAAGMGESGTGVKRLEQAVMATARRHGVRVIGPDWVGLMRPHLGLNATFSRSRALPGQLALVSQSGALTSAVLDWAESRRVGFSTVCSLGDTTDVDFGDVLDYLALDPETRSILLYVETITDARRFMGGLRAAARLKPVIVMKVGRQQESYRATSSHTGALVGADDAFDAALGRAGAVRVPTIGQLFAAAELLASGKRLAGDRIAVITNGGGPGIIATDLLVERQLQLARLGEKTLAALNRHLPARWPGDNPVDVLGDADPKRFAAALDACLDDDNVDGALVILAPQARTDPEGTAEQLCQADTRRKPVLGSWMGGSRIRTARERFTAAGFPNFATPENATEALSALSRYRRSQALLMQLPDAASARSEPDLQTAQEVISRALEAGQTRLTPLQSKTMLQAFAIPVTTTMVARSAEEARDAAQRLGLPVAMKINSPEITHKAAVDGVRLNLVDGEAVAAAYTDILEAVRKARPDAAVDGVSVEPMHTPRHGSEIMLGVVRDPVFGPVISFGAGGSMVEVIRDRAVSLPPLNDFLARDLMARTRVGRFLQLDQDSHLRRELEHALLRLSDLVCSLPRVTDVDINPVIADAQGVVAVDARIHVRDSRSDGYGHMAIMPYPRHLARRETLPGGHEVLVRPIRPEDAEMEQAFIEGLSDRSRYYRFMDHMGHVGLAMLVRFTQIDYDREMALVAVDDSGETPRQVGVARYVTNPDGRSCEFAVAVADDWQGRGLGRRLMERLMTVARERDLDRMEGQVLAENRGMLGLMDRLGFRRQRIPGDYSVVQVERSL
ncbi:bifunctional acetate--CoA ligase family protein/GNAT family N-acetyltransferase [Aquisalimonas lutea]|uniref:bifunctional acetate--CoA ligase family protein/GNAT family N-acetyltransferase n=1 Tax=Aquisalimonas lutea TaxID=1327750 RepID=UPI0025B2FBF7|nr:bifunctional acetate--CoA ligase family protein/GNAT family N-acetyltransferase [Aquisalimonas lutea]MDN3516160.1 bifunctional acetate--CoA ligase family protein/GNAT family N-acetyltransferase [Aquisalimonas lutea]